ncbi:hypothetical protein DVA78_20420, partial [Acinetobacter baumannii]
LTIPWRVAAAGVEEEGSLGALLVARPGVGGVQRWCGFKVELGASIYRRLEGGGRELDRSGEQLR